MRESIPLESLVGHAVGHDVQLDMSNKNEKCPTECPTGKLLNSNPFAPLDASPDPACPPCWTLSLSLRERESVPTGDGRLVAARMSSSGMSNKNGGKMTTRIIGIDPGVNGAIALLEKDENDDFRVLRVVSMPTDRNTRGKKVLDHIGVARMLQLMAAPSPSFGTAVVFMENVQPVPGTTGVSGAFQYGKGVGVLMGMIYAWGWPLHLITPAQWKRRAGLIKTDKDASRRLAIDLYPLINLRLKKDSDRAEAILIAHFGWRLTHES